MDCRGIEFSPEKSQERIESALKVFRPEVLNKILAFSVYLLGAKRRSVADMVGMPEESVKTTVRVSLRDGFAALRDRRYSGAEDVSEVRRAEPRLAVRREDEYCVVDFGVQGRELRIPFARRLEARTILLSLLNADLLSTAETAGALGLSCSHCRELAEKLQSDGAADAMTDKRQGQKQDYLAGPEIKAEIIRQFAARVVAGQNAASDVISAAISEERGVALSPRTVRWHMQKLGLGGIRKTLPGLVNALKKTS
jgi:transposase